ncbi:FMRFamide-related peptides [Anoplophora glabripennis]|uniref:FMRFamide-related peptides n=1 Tax=Anoplophora glabripennis TaxID=217634 RepID=UPI000C7830D6|nr:FMRFamide-related peptides [Anoplophora glabripennis]
MIIIPIISILLIQSSLAFLEDSYPETFDSNTYPEDLFDNDNDIEVQRRSNHFLRFGRNNGKYENNEVGNDDYEDFARPTRSGRIEKNDHFIRFGRGKHQEFLRFGRDPQRRDKSAYLRFGKNEMPIFKEYRHKRDTFSDEADKRSDSFLRFGRNSNFMRFGRDPTNYLANPGNMLSTLELLKMQEQTLANVLAQLMLHKKEENKPCTRAA